MSLSNLLATGAILTTALWCCSSLPAQDPIAKPVKIFILAGQSNCVGKGNGDELPPEYKTDSGVKLYQKGYGLKGWQPLAPYPSEPSQAKMYNCGATMFGPEIAFGHEMQKRFPDQEIGIIKVCVGGTSITSWSKDFGSETNKKLMEAVGYKNVDGGKNLYTLLVDDVKTALAALTAENRPYEVSAFVWIQAERDTHHPDAARDWGRRVVQLHQDLADEIGYSPAIPLVVMAPHLHLRQTSKSPQHDTIATAIRKAAAEGGPITAQRLRTMAGLDGFDDGRLERELGLMGYHPPLCYLQAESFGIMSRELRDLSAKHANLAIVESDDLPTHEGLHFNSEGQIELGRRLATGFFDLTNQSLR